MATVGYFGAVTDVINGVATLVFTAAIVETYLHLTRTSLGKIMSLAEAEIKICSGCGGVFSSKDPRKTKCKKDCGPLATKHSPTKTN